MSTQRAAQLEALARPNDEWVQCKWMQHADFNIGLEFHTAAGRWRCTDIGTRVIVAIRLDAPDASWYNGPPYAIAETVLDENDLEGCSPDALAVAAGIK